MLKQTDNLVQSFQLESSHLRGRAARMGTVLDLILHQHAYPDPVGHLLAEAIVIASLLASSLKYEGVFTLQAKGDGIVSLLVADITHDGGIRAYAQFDKTKIGTEVADARLLGKGYLAFTCSLAHKEDRYQGIVTLEGDSLAEAVQHYFRQSEQLPTGISVAASRDASGRWRGGGLLLQRMPREGGSPMSEANLSRMEGALSSNTSNQGTWIDVERSTPEAEDWTRAMIVMGTCTPQELTDATLPTETLLFRLFHEEGVRVYEPLHFRHQCRCSQPRVEGMLRSLPREEIEDLAIEGLVTVTCEFCNKNYLFDGQARERLYAVDAPA